MALNLWFCTFYFGASCWKKGFLHSVDFRMVWDHDAKGFWIPILQQLILSFGTVYTIYPYPHPFKKIRSRTHMFSKASCRSAIDAARNVVEEFRDSSRVGSGGLAELARCSDASSERDCKRVLVHKYRLALPIERSFLGVADNPSLKFPILKMESWVQFMLRNSCWHILCGLVRRDKQREVDILASFWSKYRKVCPTHDVFRLAAEGHLKLEKTAPILLHGDEGRGRKHSAYLVVSFRSILGRGIQAGERQKRIKKVKKPYLKQLCNYKGHSFTSRFMISGMRKCDYSGDNAEVFSALMSSCAEQAQSLATNGIVDSEGERHWCMLIGITGDWPWLHKSGGFHKIIPQCPKEEKSTSCSWNLPWVQSGAAWSTFWTGGDEEAAVGWNAFHRRSILGRVTISNCATRSIKTTCNVGLGLFPLLAPGHSQTIHR